jgi:hypothetical protein
MIASNKERQEYNLATICREKRKGAHEHSKSQSCNPNVNLTIMDKGVIEIFYHIRPMDEYELDETNTFIIKVLSKPSAPLLYIYLDFR